MLTTEASPPRSPRRCSSPVPAAHAADTHGKAAKSKSAKSATTTVHRSRGADGAVDATITGRNGGTTTVDRSRGADGLTDRVVTGPHGATQTIDRSRGADGAVDGRSPGAKAARRPWIAAAAATASPTAPSPARTAGRRRSIARATPTARSTRRSRARSPDRLRRFVGAARRVESRGWKCRSSYWHERRFGSAWSADESAQAAAALEDGGLVVLPDCAFVARGGRAALPRSALARRLAQEHRARRPTHRRQQRARRRRRALHAMIARFAAAASGLVERLLPGYASHIQRARTSFRPAAASAARCRRARTTRGCMSTRSRRGPTAASASCACSATSTPRARIASGASASRSRRWPRGSCPDPPDGPGEAALLAALHVTKGAQRVRPHDARSCTTA